MDRFTGRAKGKRARALLLPAMTAIGAVLATAGIATASAAEPAMSRAEKIRRLDIMLMVTGLRCRNTAHDFQADYARFASRQLPALNRASAELRTDLARQGATGTRALDRLSVEMANTYGSGHPWLACHQLKSIAQGLAEVQGDDTLAGAADQLLLRPAARRLAYAFP